MFRSGAQVNDAGLWLTIKIEKKITPDFSLLLSEEVRFDENITELGTFYTEIGADYDIRKWMRASLSYRFKNRKMISNQYGTSHAWFADLMFKKKFKPVIVQFRTRVKGEYKQTLTDEDDKVHEYYSRNKLTVKLDLDAKLVPFIFSELYVPLNYKKGLMIDKVKYCAGTEYKFNRRHSVELYYLIQKKYNVKVPETDFVIGAAYNLCF